MPQSSRNTDEHSRGSLQRNGSPIDKVRLIPTGPVDYEPHPKCYNKDVNLWSGWLQCVGAGMRWGGNQRWVSHMLWQHTRCGSTHNAAITHDFHTLSFLVRLMDKLIALDEPWTQHFASFIFPLPLLLWSGYQGNDAYGTEVFKMQLVQLVGKTIWKMQGVEAIKPKWSEGLMAILMDRLNTKVHKQLWEWDLIGVYRNLGGVWCLSAKKYGISSFVFML